MPLFDLLFAFQVVMMGRASPTQQDLRVCVLLKRYMYKVSDVKSSAGDICTYLTLQSARLHIDRLLQPYDCCLTQKCPPQ